ncbi:MAG: cytochrome c biogenesis protein ResB [Bacteroidales bacterium]|nr:cytochrome c biogenesis protein ResB [Bacteroidales bacterium]
MKNTNRNTSLICTTALLVIGCVLQLFFDDFPLHYFKFPINLIVIIQIIAIVVALFVFLKGKRLVKFLSSGYAAISAISLFTFVVGIMVLVHQDGSGSRLVSALGFDNVIETWLYAFSSFYLLISLGLVIMRRLSFSNFRNVFFFINHFGLWLVIAIASLGQADKIKINLTIPEGELIWYGYDYDDNYFEPDFAILLNKFNIDYYDTKLAIVDDYGKMYDAKMFQPCEISKGKITSFENYVFETIRVYEDAVISRDTVLFVKGLPEKSIVAEIIIKNIEDETEIKAYIQNSTSFHPPQPVEIKKDLNLVLLNPEPKYFGSEIELFTKSGIKNEKHKIEVNKPLVLNNWTIYQTSYFKSPEYSGVVSVFTAVYDPWLKSVYIGFVLMFIGAIYLIFSRQTKKNNLK